MPSRSQAVPALRLAPHERTVQTVVRQQADALGARPCLDVGGRQLAYAEVAETAARYGGALAAVGVKSGDRIAIVSENRFELLAALLGCVWLGAILVPVNTASKGPQLAHVLTDAGPRVLAI